MNWFMSKQKDPADFLAAKELSRENLQSILLSLSSCVDEGKINLEDFLYNQLITHIEQLETTSNWDELEEQISEAKVLENDIAAWLSAMAEQATRSPGPKSPSALELPETPK